MRNTWNIKFACLLIILFLSTPVLATEDDGSTLRIVSPTNGETVGDVVRVLYDFQKGKQGDHVHVYVDGKYQKGFKGTLEGLSKGRHEITLKVANSDHDVLATSDTVVIEVK